MKKLLTAGLILLVSLYSIAQSSPVKWTFAAKKIADKTYEVKYSASVNAPWHIYSQATPEGGPLPTKITFAKNPLLILEGTPIEIGKVIKKYEEVFEIDVLYFDRNVDFVQVVKLKSNVKTNISGSIEFMVCDDKQCLPPSQVPFTIELK